MLKCLSGCRILKILYANWADAGSTALPGAASTSTFFPVATFPRRELIWETVFYLAQLQTVRPPGAQFSASSRKDPLIALDIVHRQNAPAILVWVQQSSR